MAGIKISPTIEEKLKSKHQVVPDEVLQCFKNRDPKDKFLFDNREEHKTDPATLWFLAETNKGRRLKVCFIPPHPGSGGLPELKTAFEPNSEEIRIYEKFGIAR